MALSILSMALQVMSGERLPFPDREAIRPPFPEADRLMELIKICWAHEQRERPPMCDVAKQLSSILADVKQRIGKERLEARRQNTPSAA